MLVAGVGAGAQLVLVAALGQQTSPRRSGVLITGVGAGAQFDYIAALGQQAGQPPGGVLIAGGVGGVPVKRDGVGIQQAAPGTIRESSGVGGIAYVPEDGVPGAGGHAGVPACPAGVLDQVVRGDIAS